MKAIFRLTLTNQDKHPLTVYVLADDPSQAEATALKTMKEYGCDFNLVVVIERIATQNGRPVELIIQKDLNV